MAYYHAMFLCTSLLLLWVFATILWSFKVLNEMGSEGRVYFTTNLGIPAGLVWVDWDITYEMRIGHQRPHTSISFSPLIDLCYILTYCELFRRFLMRISSFYSSTKYVLTGVTSNKIVSNTKTVYFKDFHIILSHLNHSKF